MPIKFRCKHCRQFLGISHTMAGEIVDCPTCGRSIRVPDEQGRVKPIPQPRLDLRDRELAQALEELGSIGKQSPDAAETAPPREVVQVVEPAPAPVAIALPDPVPVAPRPALPVPSADAPSASANNAQTPEAILGTLQQPPRVPAFDLQRTRTGERALRETAALAGAALCGIVLGFILGRVSVQPAVTPGQQEIARDEEAPRAEPPPATPPALSGRITFRMREGHTLPDAGAMVLAFPENRRGTATLSIVGFRPADSNEDFTIARNAFRAAGGDVARVGEDGAFHLELPAPGTYRLLAISHYQSREGPPGLGGEMTALLDAWFDRPGALLGQVRFEEGQIRYNGDRPVSWDHTFELPER